MPADLLPIRYPSGPHVLGCSMDQYELWRRARKHYQWQSYDRSSGCGSGSPGVKPMSRPSWVRRLTPQGSQLQVWTGANLAATSIQRAASTLVSL